MVKKNPWMRIFTADWLSENRFLAPEERATLMTLRCLMHQEGGPIPDDPKFLAPWCAMTKGQFIKCRETLIEAEKIVRVEGKLWDFFVGKERDYAQEKSNVATRNVNERWGNRQQKQQEENTGVSDPYHSGNATQTQTHIQSQNKKETRARDNDTPFDGWWQAYPNKAGRDGAERAYAAALRDGADPDELLRGVERYRLRKPTGQAWMNPATWLTQRRWLDEPFAPEDRPGKPPSASQRVRAEILRTMGRGVVPLPEEDGKIVNGNATRG